MSTSTPTSRPGNPHGRHPALGRLDAIADGLSRDPGVLAVLGLGSAGRETERFDDHSDLDFFVVVRDDTDQVRLLADTRWLATPDDVVWLHRNEANGHKALYADGLLLEYAFFTPTALAALPHSGARVVWSHPDLPSWVGTDRPPPPNFGPRDARFQYDEALSNLLVGLHRLLRGEALTATRFIQVHAVDRCLSALRLTQAPTPDVAADPFDISRRTEGACPDFPLEHLMPGHTANAEAARACLSWIREHHDAAPTIVRFIEDLLVQAGPTPTSSPGPGAPAS